MDSIKKYFIPSIVFDDNVDKSENDDVHVSRKQPQRHENKNTLVDFKSINVTREGNTNEHYTRKIQGLEEENDRLLRIIENKNKIINDIDALKNSDIVHQAADFAQELENSTLQIKQITNKLSVSNKKICNYRNRIMQLEKELKVARNALSSEIGDPTTMQAVLSVTGSSSFRGRAQQILMLQQKVNDQQQRLNKLQTRSNDSNNAQSSTVIIRQMQKVCKETNEKELLNNQTKVSELTKSLEVWKSRSKALDVEITVLRVEIQKLLSKAELDSKLIDELKTESVNNNKQQLKTKDSIKLLQSKVEKAEQIIDQKTSALNDRDIKIAHLESKLQNYTDNETILNSNEMSTVDFSDPRDIFKKKLNELENQQLVDLLCLAHNRICKEVKAVVDFKNKFLMEQKKFQKFESKTRLFGPSTSLKQKSSNVSYQLKNELSPDEKISELQNKLELTVEEHAALRDSFDHLLTINKENVQQFAKALNNLKQQFVSQ